MAWRRLVNAAKHAKLPRRLALALSSGSSQVSDSQQVALKRKREQMLRLVAKGFYRELIRYGVRPEEILTVANNLLGHVSSAPEPLPKRQGSHAMLKVGEVADEWATRRRLRVQGVELRPLMQAETEKVASWLTDVEVQNSFVPAFPRGLAELGSYLIGEQRDYLGVHFEGELVGIVGAENVDSRDSKLEMKKLVGERRQRGRGVGTRATFGFLYYAFMIRRVHKVYVHFRDVNIRNLNINSRFGFELEGLFVEELAHENQRMDLVRMGLLKPIWYAMFS